MKEKKETTMVTVRMPIEERDKLYDYADSADLTVSQVIRKAIKIYLSAKVKK